MITSPTRRVERSRPADRWALDAAMRRLGGNPCRRRIFGRRLGLSLAEREEQQVVRPEDSREALVS
ncbi:MAG: hypothetical protein QOI70_722 [Microbacteriaceae bacterium]|nr:hypothetical protein [Microbacteriaceae bacterium]